VRQAIIRVPGRVASVLPPTALNSVDYYVFGHSLYTWDVGEDPNITPESSTGYWLGALAQANGKQHGGTGQWGQLDYHALPPTAHYKYSTNTFDPWPSGDFASQDFDQVIVMPSNFDLDFLSPTEYMPRTRRVIDYIVAEEPTTKVVLYSHWVKPLDAHLAIGGTIADETNLTAAEWQVVQDYQRGTYQSWFNEWQDLIVAQYPSLSVRMVPVGSVLADLLDNEPYMQSVAYTELYVDEAPHGTRTKYFLAALVMYRAMYLENPSGSYTNALIDSTIISNLSDIISYIDQRLAYYNSNGVRVYE